MSIHSIPKNDRQLRACLICSLVKQIDQFDRDGCDNCERFLKLRGNRYNQTIFLLLDLIGKNLFILKFISNFYLRDMVIECTSNSFEGLIGMMTPEQSWWVNKWFTPKLTFWAKIKTSGYQNGSELIIWYRVCTLFLWMVDCRLRSFVNSKPRAYITNHVTLHKECESRNYSTWELLYLVSDPVLPIFCQFSLE